jgi:RNA polymerase sigma-70 factor (ECF subfamily)
VTQSFSSQSENVTTFEAWIAAAHSGSEQALGALLEACRPTLLAAANRELRQDLRGKAGASDLVQETMLCACRGFAAFRGRSQRELIVWLKRMLHARSIDQVRMFHESKRRNVQLEQRGAANDVLPATDPTPSQQVVRQESRQRVEEALALLSEGDRLVLRLRNRDRLSFARIGELLGVSTDAARVRWFRAVKRMKDQLPDG